nr:hypothetical protein [Tanacetum cinerariifolium]
MNANNKEVTGSHVPEVFVSHYKKILGTSTGCQGLDIDGLFEKKISSGTYSNMVHPVTDMEIKAKMFDIRDDHAPGPDGYTSVFFKKGWEIVGKDICNSVRDFFLNGKLLKEINYTFIALILKVSTPLRVNDCRPISCCNMIYKCVSKILTNWIIDGIKEVVSENQSVLITQELMHNNYQNKGPPKCAFKVDIQKAYDTVDWNFLGRILVSFGFHPTTISWIMACVSSASFSLSLNGNIHGYFKGKRGLRQGDPLLPDDLFIFDRGDVESARVILESLDEFKLTSGLVPSIHKSTTFFCNVPYHVKLAILNIMPFSEGDLPVKYLGVPLISTRLLNNDFKILVERAKDRIED